MSTGGTTPFQLGFLCVFIIFSACSNTPIEDYLPKDQEEENIIALLVRYQEARKHFDLEQYLGCLHEQGSYHHASRVMLSKKALAVSGLIIDIAPCSRLTESCKGRAPPFVEVTTYSAQMPLPFP